MASVASGNVLQLAMEHILTHDFQYLLRWTTNPRFAIRDHNRALHQLRIIHHCLNQRLFAKRTVSQVQLGDAANLLI